MRRPWSRARQDDKSARLNLPLGSRREGLSGYIGASGVAEGVLAGGTAGAAVALQSLQYFDDKSGVLPLMKGVVTFDELYDRYFDFVWRSLRRLGVPPGGAPGGTPAPGARQLPKPSGSG